MGAVFLDKGQMVTGRFGRRYMVRELLESKGKIQVYEIAESGRIFMAVAIALESARLRSEFVEPLAESPVSSSEYVWPEDTFSFDYMSKKCIGYVTKNIMGKGFTPFVDHKDLTLEQKKLVGFGVAKSLSKLHAKGYVYNEVPSAWIDKDFNVCLVGLPVKSNSRFTSNDNMAVRGVSAPEFFQSGVAKEANIYTDRFMLASYLFFILIGMNPYVEMTKDPNYAYARFAFSKEVEDPLEDYGFEKVDAWRKLSDLQKAMFIKTFTAGVTNPLVRFDEDTWAHTLHDFM